MARPPLAARILPAPFSQSRLSPRQAPPGNHRTHMLPTGLSGFWYELAVSTPEKPARRPICTVAAVDVLTRR